MESTFFTRERIIEGVILVLAVAGIWYALSKTAMNRETSSTATTTEETSLGATIYAESSNPLSDVPEQKPVSNPIDDAYKNPF